MLKKDINKEIRRIQKARLGLCLYDTYLTDTDKLIMFPDVQSFNAYYTRLIAICDIRLMQLKAGRENK